MPFIARVNWKEEVPNIKKRFLTDEKISYQGLANEYGVSKERIRQILKQYSLHEQHFERKRAIVRAKNEEKVKLKTLRRGNPTAYDPVLYRTLRHKFSRKRANAIKHGIPWELNFGSLVFPEYCPVLGIKIDYFAESRQENSMSWDRTDHTKGYVDGNVQIMSWRANRIKNDGTKEEHQKIVDYLSKMEQQPL